jgi:hypothetical protein
MAGGISFKGKSCAVKARITESPITALLGRIPRDIRGGTMTKINRSNK